MTLIRHNSRTGKNQSAHYAHDTERPDVNGCYVSGRQGRVMTSPYAPCPQCGGYGALVPIRPLARATYPQGGVVPERYRLHHTEPSTPGSTYPVPVAVEPVEPVEPIEPIEPSATGSQPYQGEANETEELAAQRMAQAMLAALVPEAAKIRQSISDAVDQVNNEALERNNASLTEAIETLTDTFDETVRRLIVPTVVRIERPNTEPVEIAGTVHPVFVECLEWLQARDHENRPRNLFLTGPAGCGKTTLAKQLAQALGVDYYTTGMVISEHQIMGYEDAGGRYHSTPFRLPFQTGGLWLGDELDGWSPEATLAANGALANGHASFPDTPQGIDAHPDFYAIVAGNTWGNGADREYVGRNEMDAATLSRFVTIPMDYDQALENTLAGQWTEWRDLVWHVRSRCRELKVRTPNGTRELIHGISKLNAGGTLENVSQRVLRRNLDDATWAKVSA
jgi:hypothetical protein